MTKEALKLALEAMEGADNIDVDMQSAIVRCREALAKPVQPVDLQKRLADLHLYEEVAEHYAKCAISPEALRDWVAERVNTPPSPVQEPERQWVGLTDDERRILREKNSDLYGDELTYAGAIERTLKEKNT